LLRLLSFPPRRRRRLALGASLVVGGAWLAGLLGFVAAPGTFEVVVPRKEQPPAWRHNVALVSYGPTVRASSFHNDWTGHHHPLFAVDGRAQPTSPEKWASFPRDRRPWLEIRWREERDLDEVAIRHGGSVEAAAFTARRYQLTCLRAGAGGSAGGGGGGAASPPTALAVEDNTQAVAVHPFRCTGARGVRIDFPARDLTSEVVRIFEVEAWGR
jgi:hypothetical protein